MVNDTPGVGDVVLGACIVASCLLILLIFNLSRTRFVRFRTSLRLDQIERRKFAAEWQMRQEAVATQARMNYAIRTGSIPSERRVGNAKFTPVIVVTLLLVATTAVTAATGTWPFKQAPPNLDQIITNLSVGNCTNFTNNRSGSLPPHPLIVPCSSSDATFAVRWSGIRESNNCPRKYPLLDSWQSDSGKVVCMARVYRVGQCMQGKPYRRHIEWFDDSVISCQTKTTKKFPYVVTIVKVVQKAVVKCPRHSTLDKRSEVNLCIGLLTGPSN